MPTTDALLKIDGVLEAELTDNNMMRLRIAEGSAPQEAIVQAAVQQQWGLYQIAPDQTSLEDVFVQLTYQEAAPQVAA
jgi:ABC-2 type transport system ATP-binding protein